MQDVKIVIVIVNYHAAQDCCLLMDSILLADHDEIEGIVCVDNSCDVKELSVLQQFQQKHSNQQIVVAANTENKGFGKAINEVFISSIIEGWSFKQILLINPDVQILDGALENLIQGVRSSIESGIWGGVTVDEHDEADGYHAWREPTLLREFAWSSLLAKFFTWDILVSSYQHIHQK